MSNLENLSKDVSKALGESVHVQGGSKASGISYVLVLEKKRKAIKIGRTRREAEAFLAAMLVGIDLKKG